MSTFAVNLTVEIEADTFDEAYRVSASLANDIIEKIDDVLDATVCDVEEIEQEDEDEGYDDDYYGCGNSYCTFCGDADEGEGESEYDAGYTNIGDNGSDD